MKCRIASQLKLLATHLGPRKPRLCPYNAVTSCHRIHTAAPTPEASGKPPCSTPLARYLAEAIEATGPITLAAYMRQCLVSDLGGYYTTERGVGTGDQFGRKGDFITSPEISQVFGELIGIWVVSEWMRQRRQGEKIQIIELGPGRGTLMSDLWRVVLIFKTMADSVEAIYLVEASSSLREAQKVLLCGPKTKMRQIENGFACQSKASPKTDIIWYEDFSFIPRDKDRTPYIIAHEFFDALPIHAFTNTDNGWREMLVNTSPGKGQFITKDGVSELETRSNTPEFSLALANAPTPHSILLPPLSQRYKDLEKLKNATIEISPESLGLMEKISQRIGEAGAGAALIMDYGTSDTVPANSLRGILKHEICSPFSRPGEVDVSADVDFTALAEKAINSSKKVEVHGPVKQRAFLGMLGIKERTEFLIRELKEEPSYGWDDGNEEKEKALRLGHDRLVGEHAGGMGAIYKALAVIPARKGRRPVGFGGEVTGEKD
ncbi:unnamed protein product [Tuber melanosporum]|uniref:Protein arginine methyltransferase NDUFAF7 n=1 Tax=Tuber melanosporum (strain Mel28) TaxID=656061 RepID=D5GIG9_TUBMM|nr:uncharacterized protein GSTUM_00008494001 [Tuber melanosporum]CAZ84312.1 unnamed protein product [Tuber melanosporum]